MSDTPMHGVYDFALTSQQDRPPARAGALKVVVELQSPGGKPRAIDAFWDGGRTWRFRYSPDETGAWSWRTTAADASDAGLHGVAGRFTCTPADKRNPLLAHGPIVVSKDSTHFTHSDGTPWFWLADTAWNGVLASTDEQWKTYLAARAQQRFTAVQFVATHWRGRRKDPSGERAFHRDAQGEIELNPAFFGRIDHRVAMINAHGMVAVPVMMWAIGKADPGQELSEAEAIAFGRYLQARWGAHSVVWFLAGDGDYRGDKAPRWHRIGQGIFADRERGHYRLATMHPGGLHWIGDDFRDQSWYDFVGVQTGHGDGQGDLRWAVTGPYTTRWNVGRRLPFVNLEPNYEAHPAYQSKKEHTDLNVRRAAYWSLLLAPTAGVTFGHNAIWVWNQKTGPAEEHGNLPRVEPWHTGVDTPGVRSMAVMREILSSLPWWKLRPMQKLVAVQPGEKDLTRWVAAAAGEGGPALVYTPATQALELDLTPLGDRLKLTWINPADGKRRPAGAAAASGRTTVTPPADAGTADHLLLIERQGN